MSLKKRMTQLCYSLVMLLAACEAAPITDRFMQGAEPGTATASPTAPAGAAKGVSAPAALPAPSVAPDPEDDGTARPPDKCCSWGSYRCPVTGEVWDYESVGCGLPLKPAAKKACAKACEVACIDSGWFSECDSAEDRPAAAPPSTSGTR